MLSKSKVIETLERELEDTRASKCTNKDREIELLILIDRLQNGELDSEYADEIMQVGGLNAKVC